jgi:flagellum-specific peptidoglycan hydrolase FlgJ
MVLTQEQQQALTQIASAAVNAERATGIPAELSAAQCILESAWLTRAPGNNCFGIKATDHNGAYAITKEYLNGQWVTQRLAFKLYPSLADCFLDHAQLIQEGPYLPVWQQYGQDHDIDGLIAGIARHYATDPGYAAEVTTLAHGPNVETAIVAARL